MVQNHVIMKSNAIILIVIGAIGFMSSGSPTALIADAVGLILFFLSFPTKNENHIAAHIAVGLTMITAVSFVIVGVLRGNPMIIVMGAVSFVAFDLYILNFIKRRKEKQSKIDSV